MTEEKEEGNEVRPGLNLQPQLHQALQIKTQIPESPQDTRPVPTSDDDESLNY